MLDEKTVLSTTAPRLTLLQYLKTIEKLLDGASLKNIETVRVSDNIVKLKFNFTDGSVIYSEDIKTSGGGAGSEVETNDGTNGSNILGITIDGKRYSFKDYKTDAGDLLQLIVGSDTVTVDLADGGQHLEVHLDEIYKQSLVTRSELNRPIDLPAGTNLLSYNWDAYTNGTWFKGNDLAGMPEGTKGEFLIQLVKARNTRFALYLYNTDIYENNTGNYINYHYADKFEGWQKIQTDLNASFVKKFVPIYDKYNSSISYGKENGIGIGENISDTNFVNNFKKYNHLMVKTNNGIFICALGNQIASNIYSFGGNILKEKTEHLLNYLYYLKIEGNKLIFNKEIKIDLTNYDRVNYGEETSPYEKIIAIFGGDLYD